MKKNKLNLKKIVNRKQFKYGSYAAGMTSGLIIVVLLINIIVVALDDKYDLSVDMTANRVYSLTSQTKHILENLNQDIYIYTLFDQGNEDPTIENLLDKYKTNSKYIHVSNIDMVRNPGIVSYYENIKEVSLTTGGTIITTSEDPTDAGQQFKILDVYDMYSYDTATEGFSLFTGEDAITGAIQYVLNPNIPKVWFLEGHGTKSSDWAEMRSFLEDENYNTEGLSLIEHPEDLQKGDILIVFGPSIDLAEDEREILLDFATDGGKILFLFNSTTVNSLPNFLSILSHYNIGFEDGLVVEDASSGSSYYYDPVNIIPDYKAHDITNALRTQSISLVLPYAGALSIGAEQSGITISSLMESSDSAFLEKIDEQIDGVKNDDAKEGPFVEAVAVTKEADLTNDEVQMIIVANAGGFLSMSQMPTIGNYEFFMNSVSWLNPVEDDFYIRGKSLQSSVLYFKTMGQIWTIIIIVCLIIPLGAFAAGIIVFLKRRHL